MRFRPPLRLSGFSAMTSIKNKKISNNRLVNLMQKQMGMSKK